MKSSADIDRMNIERGEAVKIFDDEIKKICHHFEPSSSEGNSSSYHVIYYYGAPNLGKTRLVEYLKKKVKDSNSVINKKEAGEFSRIITPVILDTDYSNEKTESCLRTISSIINSIARSGIRVVDEFPLTLWSYTVLATYDEARRKNGIFQNLALETRGEESISKYLKMGTSVIAQQGFAQLWGTYVQPFLPPVVNLLSMAGITIGKSVFGEATKGENDSESRVFRKAAEKKSKGDGAIIDDIAKPATYDVVVENFLKKYFLLELEEYLKETGDHAPCVIFCDTAYASPCRVNHSNFIASYLVDIVRHSPRTLWIFTGRDRIDESDSKNNWTEINPVKFEIGLFTEIEENSYLANAEINREYKDDIRLHSARNPYLLNVLCNYFHESENCTEENQRKIPAEDIIEIRETILDRYIDNHDVAKNPALFLYLVYLSDGWTDEFIRRSVDEIPGYTEENFRYIKNLSIVRFADGKYRMDESVRKPLAEFLAEEEKEKVRGMVCTYLKEAMESKNTTEIDDAIRQITAWGITLCEDIFCGIIENYIRHLIVLDKRDKARAILDACDEGVSDYVAGDDDKDELIFCFWLNYSWYFYYLFCGHWIEAGPYEDRCNEILKMNSVANVLIEQLKEKNLSEPAFLSSKWPDSPFISTYGILYDSFIDSSDYEWAEAFDLYKESKKYTKHDDTKKYLQAAREKAIKLNNGDESVFSIICYGSYRNYELVDFDRYEVPDEVEKTKKYRNQLIDMVGENSIPVMELTFAIGNGLACAFSSFQANIYIDFRNECIDYLSKVYIFSFETFGYKNCYADSSLSDLCMMSFPFNAETHDLAYLCFHYNCEQELFGNVIHSSRTSEHLKELAEKLFDNYDEIDCPDFKDIYREFYTVFDEEVETLTKNYIQLLIGEYSVGDDCSRDYGFYQCQNIDETSDIPFGKLIGKHAFSKSSIKKVDIPEGVESIGEYAFYDCPELTEVRISGSVKVIGTEAFSSCPKLKTIILSSGINEINYNAFSNCTSLNRVVIPGTVRTLSGFCNCNSLSDLTILSGVEKITSAFKNASSLRNIAIPGSVREISDAFNNAGLNNLKLNEGIEEIYGAFNVCNISMIHFPDSLRFLDGFNNCRNLLELEIPLNVEKLSGFVGCLSLEKMHVPSSVKSISGFSKCDCLESVEFEEGLESIGGFDDCPQLQVINFPSTIYDIGGFNRCESLRDVKLPESLQVLRPCFNGCPGITELIIPPKVRAFYWSSLKNFKGKVVFAEGSTIIPKEAFKDAKEITDIIIPDTVSEIESEAFFGCSLIESITVPATLKRTPTDHYIRSDEDVYAGAFSGYEGKVVFPDGFKVVPEDMFRYSSVSKIELSETVKCIGKHAFADLSTLTELALPEGLKIIGTGVFENCTGLKNMVIPDSITSVSNDLFSGCKCLEAIRLSESTTSIGESAFENCEALKDLRIPDSVTSIGGGAFSGCISLSTVEIPAGINVLGSFFDKDGEKGFLGGAFQGYTGHVVLRKGIKEILASDFKGSDISAVTIPDSVKKIDDYAFAGCRNLKEIEIPDSVEYIGENAFCLCANLEKVTLSKSIREISSGLFSGCSSLREINNLSENMNITSVGDMAFKDCESLEKLTFRSCLTTIGEGAFDNCHKLLEVNLPDSVTDIMGYAFRNCSSLFRFRLPGNLAFIGFRAFSGCEKIRVNTTRKLRCIASYAFEGCKCLEYVQIPKSVQKMGTDVFSQCTNLRNVILEIPEATDYFENDTEQENREYRLCDDTGYEAKTSYDVENINWNKYQTFHMEIGDNASKTIVVRLSRSRTGHSIGDSLKEQGKKTEQENRYKSSFRLAVILGNYAGKITIAEGTRRIISSLLSGDMKISELEIPYSVQIIDSEIIKGCENLQRIAFNGTKREWCILKKAEDWNIETSSYEIQCFDGVMKKGEDEDYCDDSCPDSITIPDGVSEIFDGQYGYYRSREVIIPESVRKIGQRAFCNLKGVKKITLPAGLEFLGEESFSSCQDLEEVVFTGSVSVIEKGVFYGCRNLTCIEIPDGVREIGDRAFYDCANLATLKVPGSVVKIGNEVFRGCENLSHIEICDGVSELGAGVFGDCINLKSVDLPDSIRVMGNAVFAGCKSLEKIKLSNNVKELGSRIFENCGNLKEIVIPRGVSRIGGKAFSQCLALSEIIIPLNTTEFGEETEDRQFAGAFEGYNGKTSFEDGIEVIPASALRNSSISEFTIPDGVKSIQNYAFAGCRNLQTIDVPESVVEIEEYAFSDCSKLTSLFLPSRLKRIATGTFEKCSSLANLDIPVNVIDIGCYAFRECESLKKITIPSGVEEIKESAFEGCKELSEIGLHEKIRRIQKKAFSYCSSLSEIVFPESIEKIGRGAFSYCSNLRFVKFSGNDVDDYFTQEDLIDYLTDKISREAIAEEAFKGCTSLESIVFPESLHIVPASVFEDCKNLSAFDIPKNVSVIGDAAFRNCQKLETISIPSNVEKVGRSAFEGCINLKEIVISEGVREIGINAFNGCTNLMEIRIPRSVTVFERKYREDPDNEKHLDGVFSGYNGKVTFNEDIEEIPEGVLAGACDIVDITIPPRVKKIGKEAFAYCKKVREIKLPEGVTELESDVFQGCSAVKEILIPKSVGEMRSPFGDFQGQVILEEGIGKIPGYAFSKADRIKSVNIPGSVRSIEEYSFSGCAALEDVIISDGVESIGDGAFEKCTELKEIILPDSVKSIGEHAFEMCTRLETVTFSEELESIGSFAFSDCTSLRKIEKDYSIQKMGGAVFNNCNSLKTVYISYSTKEFGCISETGKLIGTFYGYPGKYIFCYYNGKDWIEDWYLRGDGSKSLAEYRAENAEYWQNLYCQEDDYENEDYLAYEDDFYLNNNIEPFSLLPPVSFGYIEKKGDDSFFVDNDDADMVKFRAHQFNRDAYSFWRNYISTAVEDACTMSYEKNEDVRMNFSVDLVLSACESLTVENERKSSILSVFINTFMNNLGMNALAALLMELDSSVPVYVVDEDGYMIFVERGGRKFKVITSRWRYNLMLMDASSVKDSLDSDATVLIRISPSVEDYLKNSLSVCCNTLKKIVDSGASDAEAVSMLNKLISESNNVLRNCIDAVNELRKKRDGFNKGSREYQNENKEYSRAYGKKESASVSSRMLTALKKRIETLKGSTISVSSLKCGILKDIFNCEVWRIDAPGFVSRDDVMSITEDSSYKIMKGQSLNYMKFDSDIYYVRSRDLRPFEDIKKIL